MNAIDVIAALDRDLAADGETLALTRPGGATVSIRAQVRGYQPRELLGNIVQGDTLIVCSPTQMTVASWPLPPEIGDKIVRGGFTLNVQAVNTLKLADTIVRIELQVRG